LGVTKKWPDFRPADALACFVLLSLFLRLASLPFLGFDVIIVPECQVRIDPRFPVPLSRLGELELPKTATRPVGSQKSPGAVNFQCLVKSEMQQNSEVSK